MNIVICGAGEVGRHSAEVLAPAGHNITLIDRDEDKLAQIDQLVDIRSLPGDCTRAEVLKQAGVDDADLFISATRDDEVNLLSASVAAALGCDTTIARVHHSQYFEGQGIDYAGHFGIDHLVCPEHTTAVAVATTLRSPGAQEVENFARGSIELHRLTVGENAKAVGKPLSEISLPKCCLVAAVKRGDEAFRPTGATVLKPGDLVTLLADEETITKAFKVLGVDAPRRYKVMVMGGTTQGVWLCRELRQRYFQVRLFEVDADRAAMLAEKLPWVTVLSGDIIHSDVLLDERVDQADAFVAVTDDDETNILAAARAKTMGAKQAITVLQRSTYLHLLRHVGVDRAFSPRSTAVNEILRRIEGGPVRSLATLADGVADVFEVRVGEKATGATGKPLREVELPEHALVAVIQREGKSFVPGADDELKPRDTAMVVAPGSARKSLRKVFTG
ncbi:MAG: Trk system potassium transporter TrkA [Planctomycetota bacterium]